MKRKNLFLYSLALLLLAAPVQACPAIEGQQVDVKAVKSFMLLAEKMGVKCPAYYKQASPHTALIEYLDEGDKLSSWQSMMTVNMVRTGARDPEDVLPQMLQNFMDGIQKAGGKAAIVGERDTRNQDAFRRGRWIAVRYELGEGAKREDSIAILRSIAPKLAAFVHYQHRGHALSDETAAHFMRLNGM